MSIWGKELDLVVSIDQGARYRLFESITSSSEALPLDDLVVGDAVMLRVWLAKRPVEQAGPPVIFRAEADSELALVGRVENAAGDLVFQVENFTEVEVDGVYHYTALLDLSETHAVAAMDGRTEPLLVAIGLHIESEDGTRRRTIQFAGKINPKIALESAE